MPKLSSGDERPKNGSRGFIDSHRSLRVPLHRKHKVIGRGSFYCLNNSILLGSRYYA